jgi:hypothetical protein
MRIRSWCAGLLAVPLLLAGCAAASSDTGAAAAPSSPAPSGTSGDAPSPTAAMICGDEVVGDVTAALSLSSRPATQATWTDHVYTCRYSLPTGPLVLAVKESPDRASAADYFGGQQQQLGETTAISGLGERAYQTATGTVVVLKDALTLVVDATALPEVVGDNGQRREALADQVASIVMGCWTGG